MTTTISGTVETLSGAPIVGVVGRFKPAVTPLFVNFGSGYVETEYGEISVTPDSSGHWSTTEVPAGNICDPADPDWLFTSPTGAIYKGPIPHSGSYTLKDLLDGVSGVPRPWGLVSAPAANPTATVSGTVGPTGPAGPGNYQHNGTDVGTESKLDFEDSATVTATVTDDPVNGRVKISLTAPAAVDATTTTPGLVEVTNAPSGAHSVALTTDSTAMPSGLLGTTGTKATAGNDSRLSDARPPLGHHATHEHGGTDEVSLDASQILTGILALARIPGHHATHEPGGTDALDLTKLFPSGAALPTLPNSLYPSGAVFIRTSDQSLWQNQGGTWTQTSISPSYTLPDAAASAIGGVEVPVAPHTGHPTALVYASLPSGDTTGATDNTNLQADITALSTAGGGTLRLWCGVYYITNLTVPSGVALEGTGRDVTNLYCPSPTSTAITITAAPCDLRNFTLFNNSATTPTAGAGIASSSNSAAQSARFDNLLVDGFFVNFDLTSGGEWLLTRSIIQRAALYNARIRNDANVDDGDMSISNCMFMSWGGRNLAAHVRYESGGGLRFENNKMNGTIGSAQAAYGLELAMVDGGTTVDLFVQGNSIENFTTAGVYVHLKGPSHTGVFRNVIVTGNQFGVFSGSGQVGVQITPEATGKISTVMVEGNTFDMSETGTVAYSLANVDTVTIGPNTYHGVGTPLSVGAGVTNLIQTATNTVATTSAFGVVEVDSNSSGAPVAITRAGYLASLVNLTHSNLAAAAGITVGQLSSGAATAGSVATADGLGGVAYTAPTGGGGVSAVYSPLTDPGNGSPSLIFDNTGDVIAFPD